MYHEEKIIDGVLCWRGTPDGEWTQKTAKQLTEMLIEAREKIAMLEVECMAWRRVHARVESRLMDAETLLAEAADFVSEIKVGVSTKRRDGMVEKLRGFTVPNV